MEKKISLNEKKNKPAISNGPGSIINFVLGILGSVLFLVFMLIIARYYGPERFGFFYYGN